MIAPSLGQVILGAFGWRAIFISFVIIALLSLVWFALRMPETLEVTARAPFSLRRIVDATTYIIKNRTSLGYTLSAGLIGGAFLGYLSSAQQIFQEQYGLGERFPILFGTISLAIGLASFLNARLVMRFGMRFLIKWSLRTIVGLAIMMLVFSTMVNGQPQLWLVIGYLMLTFFFTGILFGNQNAMAMEPLGHLAGIGAAVVGSLTTLIQMPLGTLIGQGYNGTVFPLVIGLAVLSGASILVVNWTENQTATPELA